MEHKNMHNKHDNSQIAIVMVPFPAQGHLNQLLHLSHILTSYSIPVHYAGSGPHNHQAKLRLNGWDPKNASYIHFHDFQLPDYKNIPQSKPDPSIHWPVEFEPLFHASTHLRQPISQLLHQLSTNLGRLVVIHDLLMTTVVQDVTSISNAESYAFIPVSAFSSFLVYWRGIPDTDKPFKIDSDFLTRVPSDEGTVTPEIAKFISHQLQSLGTKSRLYNTCRVIEGRFLELLEKMTEGNGTKHFAIGPVNPGIEKTRSNGDVKRHRCLEWLDKQENDSVIYVAFGSTTSMTREQTNELAWGLERSQQKFIWVLRRSDEEKGRAEEIPEGFEERVKETGMVVREWAPQLDILAHPATGGFMSHCGWNSCIESTSMGVPLAAWPMHSEQPQNTLLVSEMLKIAIVVRDWEDRDKLVTSGVIEDVVRRLIASEEGAEMRKRAKELGDAIGRSVSEGGASRLQMDSFVAHITRSIDVLA